MRLIKRRDSFVSVPTKMLKDYKVSLSAKGFMMTLLGAFEDKLPAESEEYIKELEKNGYLFKINCIDKISNKEIAALLFNDEKLTMDEIEDFILEIENSDGYLVIGYDKQQSVDCLC